MGCGTCGKIDATGVSPGCGNNGSCSTGGCNKFNVFNWLSDMPFAAQQDAFKIVEVSFKNGGRKGFFSNANNLDCHTGDMVVVEGSSGGFDIGKISLSGELVRLQMKKRRVPEDAEVPHLIRIASERDLDRLVELREMEYNTMLLSRVIALDLGLKMKIGDVEYQGDGRKATFYYTADDRVDFRELIRTFAREFKVKIEMRQIGARQEAARIGGIGSCGRELCCTTWLTTFKSVSTVAARYQNLAINQSKLSGQCGRLKCCLNYELDTYLDALQDFPKGADYLKMKDGKARLVKKDIFKRVLWYGVEGGGALIPLSVEQVKLVQEMNQAGDFPESLGGFARKQKFAVKEISFEDGVGATDLDELNRKLKREKRKRRKKERSRRRREESKTKSTTSSPTKKDTTDTRKNTGTDKSGVKNPTNRKTPSTARKNKPNPNPKGSPSKGNSGSASNNTAKKTGDKPNTPTNNRSKNQNSPAKGGQNNAPKSGSTKNNKQNKPNSPHKNSTNKPKNNQSNHKPNTPKEKGDGNNKGNTSPVNQQKNQSPQQPSNKPKRNRHRSNNKPKPNTDKNTPPSDKQNKPDTPKKE
ncbi:MAG: regulatory iron-sulfur-containing complex subunit RicT [Chitinophagales bacterium]